jgi:hypothetical protein
VLILCAEVRSENFGVCKRKKKGEWRMEKNEKCRIKNVEFGMGKRREKEISDLGFVLLF